MAATIAATAMTAATGATGAASDVIFVSDYGDYDDYDPDRAFRPNGYNDWWHDRPDRAYPAWVARNTKCQRTWWSGEGWRC